MSIARETIETIESELNEFSDNDKHSRTDLKFVRRFHGKNPLEDRTYKKIKDVERRMQKNARDITDTAEFAVRIIESLLSANRKMSNALESIAQDMLSCCDHEWLAKNDPQCLKAIQNALSTAVITKEEGK